MNSPIANNDIMNSSSVTNADEEKTQRKCGNCGEFGHNKRKCPYSPRVKEEVEKKDSNRKCGKCGEFGHNARTCPNLVQYCAVEEPDASTRLEFEKKFWTVDLKDDTTMVTFGKIGTDGRREAPKKHDSKEAAMEWVANIIEKKKKKGYRVVEEEEQEPFDPVAADPSPPPALTEAVLVTETEEEVMEPTVDEGLDQCETSVEEICGTIFSFSDDGNIFETKIEWCSE